MPNANQQDKNRVKVVGGTEYNTQGSSPIASGMPGTWSDGTYVYDVSPGAVSVIRQSAGAAPQWTLPCVLSTAASGQVVGRFTAAQAGKIANLKATVIVAATTTDKIGTFQCYISGTATSGGILTVSTTATSVSLGAGISCTTMVGSNSFTAGQEITIKAQNVTAQHAEGQILLELFLSPPA